MNHVGGPNGIGPYAGRRDAVFADWRAGMAAVRGIDPTTGFYFDDTKRYVDALDITPEERHAIFEGNARRVFPRMDAALKAKGR